MVTIYLSSTLKDLLPEREAVKQALSGKAVVKESYDADENSVRESCLKDVEGSDVYVGLIGLRYGFSPPGESKSITELEFDQAQKSKKRILLFAKSEQSIPAIHTDAFTKERDPELIRSFRARLKAGTDDVPRPAVFDDPAGLKEKLLRALLKEVDKESEDRADPAPPGATELQKMLAAHLNEHWAEISRSRIFMGADVFSEVSAQLSPAKVFAACVDSPVPLRFLTRLRGFVGKAADGSPIAAQLAAQPYVLEAVLRLTLVAAERFIASKADELRVALDEPLILSSDPRVSAVLAAACFGFGIRLRPAAPYPETFVRPSAEEYLHEQGGTLLKRDLRAAADRFTLADPPEHYADDQSEDDEILQGILDYAQEKLGCRLVLLCRENSGLRRANVRANVLGKLDVPLVFEGVPRNEIADLLAKLRSLVAPVLDGLIGKASTSAQAETS
ncbi:DUF4062 domain-containing protein [Zoogloea sp.]|uniref:DUF4062 domain-containing protein n=1 Tax=Zoogloea sp. TaxID=49181 RepID=UPI002C9A4F1D|nr:DUF4062 domain-containing protein [Zoogloea sp.]